MIIATSYPYTGNGLGGLPDSIEAIVSHEINGIYELMFRYPVTGLHYDELISGRIVMAPPDDLTDEQPFRIYRITKPLNGIVTVYARHLCYDMQGIVVEPFTASDLTTAFQVIPTKCEPSSPITLQTTRSVATGMSIVEPRPLWKLIGGQKGSILDVYGGEWDFDKDVAKLVTQLGTDRGVNIRYGKNMTEMEQDATIESTYSDVYPYWYDEETNTLVTITEKTVPVVGSLVTNRVYILDCSDYFENQPSEQDLRDRANAYITANSIGNAKSSWKVSFVDISQNGFDRVMLGDTLHIYYERLDVNATARAVKTEFDVLQNRYKSIDVGKVKQNLASIIAEQNEAIENAPDMSDLEAAQREATDFIRNGSGYMRLIYNSSNQMTEIVSLDDPDILQAQSVWRWNNGGFGHSSNGYSGTYSVAITQNGSIVADFVNTGTLTANVIKAGILQDAANKNSWNMTTGALTITNGTINISTNTQDYDTIFMSWDDGNLNKVQSSMQSGGFHVRDMLNAYNRWYELDRWGFEERQDAGNASPTISRLANAILRVGSDPSAAGYGVNVDGDVIVNNASGNTVAHIGVYNSAHGYLYMYDGTSNTLRAWLDYTGLKFADSSGTQRVQLEESGLSFYNSSGTLTAEYPATGLWNLQGNGSTGSSASMTGRVINLGVVTASAMGIAGNSTPAVVAGGWLAYCAEKYPHAKQCIFEGVALANSYRMMRCMIYDTEDVSGIQPNVATGQMQFYDGALIQFGTVNYSVWTRQVTMSAQQF